MPRTYFSIFRCVAAVLLAAIGTSPAWADFYTLDGKFACLSDGEANCADRGHAADKLIPKKPAESPAVAVPMSDDPLIQAPPSLSSHAKAQNGTVQDPLHEIASRIEAGKPSSEDLHRLRTLSRSGDGRAIELLAWCDYFGLGLPRDPVAAYILYGIASLAGVAGASVNQAVIYNYVLTPNQRQMVLDIQNDDFDFDAAP
jgi:TPR repeat protein